MFDIDFNPVPYENCVCDYENDQFLENMKIYSHEKPLNSIKISNYTILFTDMDNLEYFHGPSLVDHGKINEERKQCDKQKSEVDQRSNEDPINTDIKHMPMPPTNTNFKAISAAALVASRRKVIMKYNYRIVIYILKFMT